MENIEEEKAYTIYKKAEEYYQNNDLVNALECYKEARKLYYDIYSDVHISALSCYLSEACIYRTLNRIDVSYVLFKLAFLISKEINFDHIKEVRMDFEGMKLSLFQIIEQNAKSQDPELLGYFEKLLNVSKLEDYDDDAHQCYRLLASMSQRDNEKQQAIDYTRLAILNLQNYEHLNREEIADCYEYMGNIYTQMGNFKKAIESYEEAGVYLGTIYDKDNESYYKIDIARLRTYIYANDLNHAKDIYEYVFALIENKYLNSVNSLNMALEIADAYYDVKVYDEAIKTYKTALKCAKIIFDKDINQYNSLKELVENKLKQVNLHLN